MVPAQPPKPVRSEAAQNTWDCREPWRRCGVGLLLAKLGQREFDLIAQVVHPQCALTKIRRYREVRPRGTGANTSLFGVGDAQRQRKRFDLRDGAGRGCQLRGSLEHLAKSRLDRVVASQPASKPDVESPRVMKEQRRRQICRVSPRLRRDAGLSRRSTSGNSASRACDCLRL